MLKCNYSKGKSEVINMDTKKYIKYLNDTIDFILNNLSKVRIENLTAKGKYDILTITAEKQSVIMYAFKILGEGVKDYKNKKVVLKDGISISMEELEEIEKKLLKVRFILVDMQKELLDVDDLMLDGMDAVNKLKAEIF